MNKYHTSLLKKIEAENEKIWALQKLEQAKKELLNAQNKINELTK